MNRIINILIIFTALLLYTQLSDAAPILGQDAEDIGLPHSAQDLAHDAQDTVNPPHATEPGEQGTLSPSIHASQDLEPNHEAHQAPEERVLESRTNIMPGLNRLLPVLNAFGNIGHSGHKEGGKVSVPA